VGTAPFALDNAGPISLGAVIAPCPRQGIYPYNTSLHVPRTGQYAIERQATYRALFCEQLPAPLVEDISKTPSVDWRWVMTSSGSKYSN